MDLILYERAFVPRPERFSSFAEAFIQTSDCCVALAFIQQSLGLPIEEALVQLFPQQQQCMAVFTDPTVDPCAGLAAISEVRPSIAY